MFTIRENNHKTVKTTGKQNVMLRWLVNRTRSLSHFFSMFQRWNNTFLMWKPSNFGGLKKILVSPEEIWAPDIVLFNK